MAHGHYGQQDDQDKHVMAEHLDAAVKMADQFAMNAHFDHGTRMAYKQQVSEYAEEIFAAYQRGEKSARVAAQEAYELRNMVRAAARAETSLLARAVAEVIQHEAKPIESLLEKYATGRYGRGFRSLAANEQEAVCVDLMHAAKRSNTGVSGASAKLAKAGRGVMAMSALIAVKHVHDSEDKKQALLDEIVGFISGSAGGYGGAAAARFLFGPGAPVLVAAGMAIGAFAGVEAAHSAIKKHLSHAQDDRPRGSRY